jgi:hypothetical protein
MAVATQHDWPRTGVHLHANSLEPNTRHSRRSGEVLRTRPESTLVGCRVDIGDGRPRCGTANEKRAGSIHQLATAGYDRHNTSAVRIYGVLCFGSRTGIRALERT